MDDMIQHTLGFLSLMKTIVVNFPVRTSSSLLASAFYRKMARKIKIMLKLIMQYRDNIGVNFRLGQEERMLVNRSTPQQHKNGQEKSILEETEIGSSRDQVTQAASALSVSGYSFRVEAFSAPRSPSLW